MYQTEFCVMLVHFLLFYPPNSLKNQKFQKKKREKYLEILFYTSVPKIMIIGVIIIYRCRCNYYFSFWAILFPFTPSSLPNSPKNKNFKKTKKKA